MVDCDAIAEPSNQTSWNIFGILINLKASFEISMMSATCFLDDNHMQALTVSESVTEVGDFDRFPMGASLADSEASLGLQL